MTWKRRLFELSVAGGTITGCFVHDPIPCGNANPDPCICGRTADPEHSPQCIAEDACRADGHDWEFALPNETGNGGVQLDGHCDSILPDAGAHD